MSTQKPKQQQSHAGRMLPHNLEAEQGVLACFLIDADASVGAFSRLNENDFYSPSHKTIFNIMRGIYEKGQPIDFVTVVSALDTGGKLDSVGGISYITTLSDLLPSSANFKYYLDILHRSRVLRKLIGASNTIIETSYSTDDAQTALSAAEKAIFDISKEDERKELTHMSVELPAVIDKLDMIQRDPTSVRGLRSGFFALDNITNGFQKSDLIIVAARPSVGKTALALNLLTNAAIKYGAKCAIFSLEMSKSSLATRALCSVGKVSLTKAMKGELGVDEWRRLWEANKRLGDANIYVDDNSLITPAEIMRKCMRLKREQGLDLVMIDYLGLMTGGGKRESRQVEVADNSRMIKIMAKELNVPVILLSQLNRGIESRKGQDGKPMLSDLRESGAIEQDADIVMFIHKEKVVQDDDENWESVQTGDTGEAELIIAKHRNGPTGSVKVGWVGEWVSFVNLGHDQSAQDARDVLAKKKNDRDKSSDKVSEAPKKVATPKTAGKKEEKVEQGSVEDSGVLDVF